MNRIKDHDNLLLMQNLSNDDRTNLSKCFEQIVDGFCEEKAIKEITSFNKVKSIFHDEFHESFLCIVSTLLFKFLINKGVVHIFKPRTPLAIPCYIDWHKTKREWEKLVKEIEWEYLLRK